MKTRRGSSFWSGELGNMVSLFNEGDVVVSTLVRDTAFTGVVREVHPKLNKVLVAWGGGSVVQHDPDEIMLHPFASADFKARMSQSNLGRFAKVARRMRHSSVGFDTGKRNPNVV